MPSHSNSNDIGSFDHLGIFNKSTTSSGRRRVRENIHFGLLHGPSTKWYKLAIQDFSSSEEKVKGQSATMRQGGQALAEPR